MVDSIRRTGSIGVITPPGPLRAVERRPDSHKERQQQGGNESQTNPEESTHAPTDQQTGAELNENSQTSAGNEGQSSTGRRIDVRI
jgi:hypothetical protein